MSRHTSTSDPLRSHNLDLSKLSPAELDQLREAIMTRARKQVDPAGTGFDLQMMATSDDSLFNTDDVTINDWWLWVERVVGVINTAASRVGLAVISAGWAVAASHMYGNAGASYAGMALGGAGVFGALFLVSVAMGSMRSR